VTIYRYINPRPSEWQEADYIVSNPPFIGNSRMRDRLGDGYVEALRQVYKNVSDTADYVMYWWHRAAELVRLGKFKRFGFITTNSIWRVFQRKTIDYHLTAKNPIRLIFAIADHPWADGGAAVRISMTAADLDNPKLQALPRLGNLTSEEEGLTPEDKADAVQIEYKNVTKIFSNLRSGVDVTKTYSLSSNSKLCCRGVQLIGRGFEITKSEATQFESDIVHPHVNGRDLLHISRNTFVIDLFGLSESAVQDKYPKAYQWVYDHVKPERDQNNRESYRRNWWIFGESRATLRSALKNVKRYIVTVETAKHRVFLLLNEDVIPDNSLVSIGLDDSYFFGVLSSRLHTLWASSTGGTLEDRPVYTKTYCFDRFPFPAPSPEQKQTIRELGEKLDAHRKRVQTQHPDVTITGMYNLLEKLHQGEPFTDNDRTYNDKALVSTLKQIHDDLDSAVFEAYGWQPDISDDEILEKLVALNAERAEEERNGLVRWLRPEYQAPGEVQVQQTLTGVMEPETVAIAPAEQIAWSKLPKEQLAAIQELLTTSQGEWTVEQIAAQFKGGGRAKKVIKENLERLEFFGYVICRTDEMGITRWQFVEIQKTA